MKPVKKILFLSFCLVHFLPLTAEVDYDLEDYSALKIEEDKRRPFALDIYGDAVAEARIRRGDERGDHVQFAELDADFGMVVYYCKEYEEGLRLSFRYAYTKIRWENNPWFSQDHFNNGFVNFSGFTRRLENWLIKSQVSIGLDFDDLSTDYMKYDFLLWGRYTYRECVGLHIGFIAYTGIDINWGCPIIGADWQISEKWKLNLVYPVNISLDYSLTQNWVLALAARTFDNRQRVERHESLPKAVIRYRNIGAEFAIRYNSDRVSANVHAGVTFDGRYRIANKHNKHGHDYHLDSAGYIGAEALLQF